MTDFTSVNPASGGFKTGSNINQKMELGIFLGVYQAAGKGLLITFINNELHASGQYDKLIYKGNFEINVSPNGALFDVAVDLTGDLSGQSRRFTATATQVDPHTVRLDQQGGDLSLTLTQNKGNVFVDPKIDISISWETIGLYVQPA